MTHPERRPSLDTLIVSNKRALDHFVIGEDTSRAMALMDAAAQHVCEAVTQHLSTSGLLHPVIAILCGPGNNGGDGIATALKVKARHPNAHIHLFDLPTSAPRSAASQHFRAQLPDDLPVECPDTQNEAEHESLKNTLRSANIIIDALFGIGLNRPLDGTAALWVKQINLAHSHDKAYVISIDIPSGLNSQTGYLADSKNCVVADETIIFTASQPGHWIQAGRDVTGMRRIVPIGISHDILETFLQQDTETRPTFLLTDTWAKRALPKRRENSHKGSFGHVLVIAGSKRMPGAACLTALAALKAGAGKVTLAAPESVFKATLLAPEIMRHPLPETPEGQLSASAIDALEMNLSQFNSLVVGPGLGLSPNTQAVFSALLNVLLALDTPLVLDADALTLWSQTRTPLKDNVIVTPHVGEATRMLGLDSRDADANGRSTVQRDLVSAAEQLQYETGANVILKASGGVLAPHPAQRAWRFISQAGNSGMATAGSGDVLTGLIAGFLAQGASIPDAMTLGIHLHGRAGDIAAQQQTPYCLLASDLIDALPQAIKAIQSAASTSN